MQFQLMTRQPAYPGDLGTVMPGWFVQDGNRITLTNAIGEPLPVGWNVELEPDEQPIHAARRALRQQRLSNPRGFRRGIDGPIAYPPKTFI